MDAETDRIFHQRLRCLKHPSVRDLAWCCINPPMLQLSGIIHSPTSTKASAELWHWLANVDQQHQALEQLLNKRKSTRLGLYYETLWRFYFEQRPEWELLAYNQQIHENGITLGAFDFLCRQGQDFWHLEMAVKFYLCTAETAEEAHNWNSWIGPNKSDRLDIKLHHLNTHQLPLDQQPAAVSWLQEHFPQVQSWHRGICLQGYFFNRGQTHKPAQLHPDNHIHRWFRLTEFAELVENTGDNCWLILERHQWLAPAQLEDQQHALTSKTLMQQLEVQIKTWRRPAIVAALAYWPEDKIWQEASRYFLVPDDWPEEASR